MRSYISGGAKALTFLAALSMVASCGLPRPGPNKREIFAGSVLKQGDAFVVTVNPRVTRATSVGITVFENVADDPLLGNTGQRVSILDQVQVDGQGFIFVPYAGRIKAAGQTPDGLRQAITRKLDAQTPDPQITVQRLAGDGATVTVAGVIGAQGVYPIERPTRTLSTMLARAGGITIDPGIALVRVTRGGQSGQVWVKDLYEDPTLDIALRAGDKIVVQEDNRKFVALGATGGQSLVPFESETLSAIEAIATVGGLASATADPTGVFVFRNEPEEIAKRQQFLPKRKLHLAKIDLAFVKNK